MPNKLREQMLYIVVYCCKLNNTLKLVSNKLNSRNEAGPLAHLISALRLIVDKVQFIE